MPEKYKDFSLMDFYKKYNWGFFAHMLDWYDVVYTVDVEKNC